MSALVRRRDALASLGRYHSPQVAAEVRLNTNESSFPPPRGWRDELAAAIAALDFHRYPDRDARELREGIGALHGVGYEEVFCANGSNEVLECLLLAFGGAGRSALVFEPTYALHGHLATLSGTGLAVGERDAGFGIDLGSAKALLSSSEPEVLFVCSPNNPTGRLEPPEVITELVRAAPGLVVVDEAYAQFSPWSALSLRASPDLATSGLVVARTFSKTWAMAGARLGYLVAHPEVVSGCEAAALPYHLSMQTQLAGILALGYASEMQARVRAIGIERSRLASGLATLGPLGVEQWPSDANFVLFRPGGEAGEIWSALLADGVLVRDVSGRRGLEGCLRVTVGTPEENDRFLESLERALQ